MNLMQFAQTTTEVDAGGGGVILFVYLVVIVLVVASMWKLFTKAGKPGWAAIVPIYNQIVLLEIVGKPVWWIVLYFIPIANVIVSIMVAIELAKVFGKGTGMGILVALLPMVGIPMLAFGDAQYKDAGGGTPAAPAA